jgi:hypothetical protein
MNPRLTESNACEAARDIATTTITTGLTNTKDHGKSRVIAWQSDEKIARWHGGGSSGCGCGCGPLEPV